MSYFIYSRLYNAFTLQHLFALLGHLFWFHGLGTLPQEEKVLTNKEKKKN